MENPRCAYERKQDFICRVRRSGHSADGGDGGGEHRVAERPAEDAGVSRSRLGAGTAHDGRSVRRRLRSRPELHLRSAGSGCGRAGGCREQAALGRLHGQPFLRIYRAVPGHGHGICPGRDGHLSGCVRRDGGSSPAGKGAAGGKGRGGRGQNGNLQRG